MLCDAGRFHHFFLDSSMETPPGPRDTTINRPPITDRVWNWKLLLKIHILHCIREIWILIVLLKHQENHTPKIFQNDPSGIQNYALKGGGCYFQSSTGKFITKNEYLEKKLKRKDKRRKITLKSKNSVRNSNKNRGGFSDPPPCRRVGRKLIRRGKNKNQKGGGGGVG